MLYVWSVILLDLPMQVNKSELDLQLEQKNKKDKQHDSQEVFKWVSYGMIVVILFCLPKYFHFREYATEHNIPIIRTESAWWCLTGFLFMFIGKYFIFEKLMIPVVNMLTHPNMTEEEKLDINTQLVKQVFDMIFHTSVTLYSFFTFGGQVWFSSLLGGSSQELAPDVFKEYPNWPTELRSEIEFFMMFQLGVNVYLLFELTVLKREYYKKINFYELLLHHIGASALLLFCLINIMPIGIMVLYIHDFSDAFRALNRIWILSKYQINYHFTSILLDIFSIGAWIYMRMLIYPLVLLVNIINSRVVVGNPEIGMSFYYDFVVFLCLSIFSLQSFWTLFMVKGAIKRSKFRIAYLAHIRNKQE